MTVLAVLQTSSINAAVMIACYALSVQVRLKRERFFVLSIRRLGFYLYLLQLYHFCLAW